MVGMAAEEPVGLLHETFRLSECPVGQVIVVPTKSPAHCREHRGGPEVERGVARGKRPQVVGSWITFE